ncbi:Uncharacterised protein [Achromobacter xylosoxidans]|nr:Uncharacterised protein [Achromobacter xylosoxidans]
MAPGLFSTTTVCLSASARRGAITRAMMSDEPPGGYGTTMRTGRVGHASAWAQAGAQCAAPSAAAPSNNCLRFESMLSPLWYLCQRAPRVST